MKVYICCLLLALTLACGGGGGSSTTPQSDTPTILNLTFSPTTLIQGDGGGIVQATIGLDFIAPRGDLDTVSLGLQAGNLLEWKVGGVAGLTSGSLTGVFNVNTSTAGTFTFTIQALTSSRTPSNILTQTITITAVGAAQAPILNTLTPSNVFIGSPETTLVLQGSGFLPNCQVLWNGAALPTAFVSETSLQVQVPASDLALAGTHQVSVINPDSAPSVSLPMTVINAQPTTSVLGPGPRGQ